MHLVCNIERSFRLCYERRIVKEKNLNLLIYFFLTTTTTIATTTTTTTLTLLRHYVEKAFVARS